MEINKEVIILGAGPAGISASYYISKSVTQDYLVIEASDSIGGTWNKHHYPGFRTDTPGANFQYTFSKADFPSRWVPGELFQNYLEETVERINMTPKIKFGEKATSINYDSLTKKWSVKTSGNTYITPSLIMATGYFNLLKPFTPKISGIENFSGEIIHTQVWKKGYLPKNKKIIVVGNGASAISLIPKLVESGNKITMLQRRAGYYHQQEEDQFYLFARSVYKKTGFSFLLTFTRWVALISADLHFIFCYFFPLLAKKVHLHIVKKELGEVAPEFRPTYTPWQSRMLYTPNFLKLYREKLFEVKTDSIDSIESNVISLKSGIKLEADILVMATGFHPEFCGGSIISVDNKPYDLTKGRLGVIMVSDLPNLFVLSGYYHQSYLFKVEWQSKYIVSLLNHMKLQNKNEVSLRMELFDENSDSKKAINFVTQTYLKRGKDGDQNPMLNPILNGTLKWSFGASIIDWFFNRFNPKFYNFKNIA
jgi:monooxygenase